jgi:HK97 family phage major capsid protein
VGNRLFERAKSEAQMHLKAVDTITGKAAAEGRDLHPPEVREAERHLEAARAAAEQAKQHRQDDQMRKAIGALGDGIGLHDDATCTGCGAPDGARGCSRCGSSAKSRAGRDDRGDVPTYARQKTSSWATDTAERIEKVQNASGVKALIAGSVDVRSPADGTVTFPQYPLRVLDLVTDRKPIEGNVFSFLRQITRDLNAAPTPDAGTKPTSIVSTQEIEGRARVVAHISEPVVERLLADFTDMQDFLRSEMEFEVLQALEAQLLSGDGLGENFTGILNTSGIFSQAYSTSPWVSVRKGLTSLEVAGEQPTAVVLHPADVEAFDLAREGIDGGWLLATAPGNITTGLPLVRSIAVPPGTALIGDWQQVRLYVRQNATLDVDRSGDLFTTNQVRLRVEGRWGSAVRRPSAFAAVKLTTA